MALTYRNYLERELELRRLKNPTYSLRAFARSLEVPAPKLSQIMRGLCGLSRTSALRLAQKLKLSPDDRDYFVALVEMEHSRSEVDRGLATQRVKSFRQDGYDEVSLEKFRIISEWHFFALLELTEVEDFQSDPVWIAKRLGITLKQTRECIELLLDHGLLAYEKSGKVLVQTQLTLSTPSGVASQSIRSHHTQILNKAIATLESVDVAERDFSALTMSVDASKISEARIALKEFRRKFCQDQQQSISKNRVYCLSMQFFPLDAGFLKSKKETIK